MSSLIILLHSLLFPWPNEWEVQLLFKTQLSLSYTFPNENCEELRVAKKMRKLNKILFYFTYIRDVFNWLSWVRTEVAEKVSFTCTFGLTNISKYHFCVCIFKQFLLYLGIKTLWVSQGFATLPWILIGKFI